MITEEVLTQHGITESEYKKITDILHREPNLTELGIFSVMWSEHCSYKSSRVHLRRLPTKGPAVLQGPGENAGIIDIGDGLAVAYKIESHNHPSFIEPFQGAATGVGGILRDIFTMGARPIAAMNSLRFGPLNTTRNKHILEGVVGGIAFYGNCFGVPTVGGEVYFADCYSQNPLVNAFALGIFEKDKIFYGRATGVGNPSSTSERKPDATASTAQPWPPPASEKMPAPSGRTSRSAIRSWKSCCSKPASKPCKKASSSASRTWARPA